MCCALLVWVKKYSFLRSSGDIINYLGTIYFVAESIFFGGGAVEILITEAMYSYDMR